MFSLKKVVMLVSLIFVSRSIAVEGLVLFTRAQPGSGYTYPGELLLSPIVNSANLGPFLLIDNGVLSAQFSPDCRKIAYVRLINNKEEIIVCDRNGMNKKLLKHNIDHPSDVRWCVYLCWRLPEKIIFSYNRSDTVFAIHPETGVESVYYKAQVGFSKVSVSLDGTRMTVRARIGENGMYNIDMAAAREWFVASGCSNWISPDGNLLTHCTGGWQNYVIRRWDDSIYKSYSLQDYTHLHHWSHNSNEWIIYQRSEDTKLSTWCNLWVQNIETEEDIQLTDHNRFNDTGRDFWVGAAPSLNITDSTPPSPPTNLHSVPTSSMPVEIKWDAAIDEQSEISNYTIYVDGSYYSSVEGTTTTLTGLEPDTSYLVTVKAVNSALLESQPSNEIPVTTEPVILAGTTLFFRADEGTLNNGMDTTIAPESIAPQTIYGTSGNPSAPQPDDSYARYTVDLPATGSWYAWGRFTFIDGLANSFWIQVDDNQAQRFGNGEHLFGTWHWEGYMAEGAVSLGILDSGEHTITIYCREPSADALLDVICLTTIPEYVPTDNDAQSQLPLDSYIHILSPDSGMQYNIGDTAVITWETDSTKITKVDIFASTNNGIDWVILNTDSSLVRESDGWHYSWVIPSFFDGNQVNAGDTFYFKVENYEPISAAYKDVIKDPIVIIGGSSENRKITDMSSMQNVTIRINNFRAFMSSLPLLVDGSIELMTVSGAVVARRLRHENNDILYVNRPISKGVYLLVNHTSSMRSAFKLLLL